MWIGTLELLHSMSPPTLFKLSHGFTFKSGHLRKALNRTGGLYMENVHHLSCNARQWIILCIWWYSSCCTLYGWICARISLAWYVLASTMLRINFPVIKENTLKLGTNPAHALKWLLLQTYLQYQYAPPLYEATVPLVPCLPSRLQRPVPWQQPPSAISSAWFWQLHYIPIQHSK